MGTFGSFGSFPWPVTPEVASSPWAALRRSPNADGTSRVGPAIHKSSRHLYEWKLGLTTTVLLLTLLLLGARYCRLG